MATDSSSSPLEVESLLGQVLHAADVLRALFVHLLHRHLGGTRPERGDELAREKVVQPFLFHAAVAERRGGERDRLAARLHPDVELGLHVHPHAVARDQRGIALADHLELQGVHVDKGDVVDDRPHEGAAVDHHLLAEETGADEGHLLGGAAVQPVHHPVDDGDDDDRQDEPENESGR